MCDSLYKTKLSVECIHEMLRLEVSLFFLDYSVQIYATRPNYSSRKCGLCIILYTKK